MTFQQVFITVVSWTMSLIIGLLLDDLLLIKRKTGAAFRWAKIGNLFPNQKRDLVILVRFIELILVAILGSKIQSFFRWGLIKTSPIFYAPLILLFIPAIYLIIMKTLPNRPYKVKWYHWLISILIWFLAFLWIYLLII